MCRRVPTRPRPIPKAASGSLQSALLLVVMPMRTLASAFDWAHKPSKLHWESRGALGNKLSAMFTFIAGSLAGLMPPFIIENEDLHKLTSAVVDIVSKLAS